jgi:hypothetical protein
MGIWNKEIHLFKKTDSPINTKEPSIWGKRIWRFLLTSFIVGTALMLGELVVLKISGLL